MRPSKIVSNLPIFLLLSVHCSIQEISNEDRADTGWDIVLIGTLDGKVHGLEASDGTLKWTMETGGCLVRLCHLEYRSGTVGCTVGCVSHRMFEIDIIGSRSKGQRN